MVQLLWKIVRHIFKMLNKLPHDIEIMYYLVKIKRMENLCDNCLYNYYNSQIMKNNNNTHQPTK